MEKDSKQLVVNGLKNQPPHESRSSLLDQSISLAYKIPYLPCRDRELSEDRGGGKSSGTFRQAHDMKALVTPQKVEMPLIVLIHSMDAS